MSKTIKYVFTLLGVVTLSLILWLFIFLGDFQEIMYSAFEPFLVNQWSTVTGRNGRVTTEIIDKSWDYGVDKGNFVYTPDRGY